MRFILTVFVAVLFVADAIAQGQSVCTDETTLGVYRFEVEIDEPALETFATPCGGYKIGPHRFRTEQEGDSEELFRSYRAYLDTCDDRAGETKRCLQFQLSGAISDGSDTKMSESEAQALESRVYSVVDRQRAACRAHFTAQYQSVKGTLCSDERQGDSGQAEQEVGTSRRQRAPEPRKLEIPGAGWLVATNQPCLVYTGDAATTAVTWTGGCVNDRAQGHGTAEFSHPDPVGRGTYMGEMHAGKKHGRGSFTWPPGAGTVVKEAGVYHQGLKQGTCTIIYTNGNRYTGEFERDVPHGTGIMTFANGYRLWVEWRNGVVIKNKPL